MRNLSFLIIILTLVSSCAENDSTDKKNVSTISVEIDGVTKNFNNVIVNSVYNNPSKSTRVEINAINSNPKESIFISFIITDNSADLYAINYINDIYEYTYLDPISYVNSNIISNTQNNIIGTFSGTLSGNIPEGINPKSVQLTNGNFNIQY
jgi:hypothetical protein